MLQAALTYSVLFLQIRFLSQNQPNSQLKFRTQKFSLLNKFRLPRLSAFIFAMHYVRPQKADVNYITILRALRANPLPRNLLSAIIILTQYSCGSTHSPINTLTSPQGLRSPWLQAMMKVKRSGERAQSQQFLSSYQSESLSEAVSLSSYQSCIHQEQAGTKRVRQGSRITPSPWIQQ